MSIDGDCVGFTPGRAVFARRQGARENVVLVGGDDQPLDRQPHALGVPAGEHVAEIAGRRGERDAASRRAERDGGGEVIDDLREDARPVDRVDAAQRQPVAKRQIAEQAFDDVLAIVEGAVDGDGVDARPVDRRHLPPLHVRHAALRIEDEDVDALGAAERLDRRRAGVARGRAEDGRAPAALAERPVHRAAEELHGEILERQRRPVEQFEQKQIVVELAQRRPRRVAEAAIGLLRHRPQFRLAPRPGDERRHYASGGLRVGLAGQSGDFGGGESRNDVRRVEAAVTGEARQHGVEKGLARRLTAGRHIIHEGGPNQGALCPLPQDAQPRKCAPQRGPQSFAAI